MSSLIAKRYVKALTTEIGQQCLETLSKKFDEVSKYITKNIKFRYLLVSGFISQEEQKELFLRLFDENDKRVINFIKLLIENNRINEFENIAKELHLNCASYKNQFHAVLLSKNEINSVTMSHIKTGLQNRLHKTIILETKQSDVEEIKITISDLNLELSISRDKIESDVINHILKAI